MVSFFLLTYIPQADGFFDLQQSQGPNAIMVYTITRAKCMQSKSPDVNMFTQLTCHVEKNAIQLRLDLEASIPRVGRSWKTGINIGKNLWFQHVSRVIVPLNPNPLTQAMRS